MQRQLGDEFWPGSRASAARAARPARQRRQGEPRAGAGAPARAGHRRRADAAFAVGIRVEGKPSLHKLGCSSDGWIEVQDEGSQLLALLTGARRGEMVVDFCAGAGGKTLALGAQMRNTGRLYAFDVSGHRLAALKPRWRAAACRTSIRCRSRTSATTRSSASPARSTGSSSTRPAPARHAAPQSRPEVAADARDARRARRAAAGHPRRRGAAVKPGGRLVYATCSPLEEDEAVAAAFDAGARRVVRRLPRSSCCSGPGREADALVERPDLRLWTHRHGSDASSPRPGSAAA
jgi:16S rRNA (cytosine967-C5)-methyltransferase